MRYFPFLLAYLYNSVSAFLALIEYFRQGDSLYLFLNLLFCSMLMWSTVLYFKMEEKGGFE